MRDLASLSQNIPYMTQGTKSIDEFYEEVCTASADLSQKLHLDNYFKDHVTPVMKFIEILTTNAFIDGLNRPISGYVRSTSPSSLIEAYKVAQTHSLAEYRAQAKNAFARNANTSTINYKNRNAGQNQHKF